jgi:simple sugar transport system permease protein
VNKAVLLAALSLGTAVAFRMKFWNIGGEGPFFIGAYGAALVAFAFPALPSLFLLLAMFAAAFVFVGAWALIPALLKARFGTSEALVVLMLNYIAAKWVSYLQYGPGEDPAANGFPKISPFSENAVLPNVLGIHVGWIITLLLCILVHLLIRKTKL